MLPYERLVVAVSSVCYIVVGPLLVCCGKISISNFICNILFLALYIYIRRKSLFEIVRRDKVEHNNP